VNITFSDDLAPVLGDERKSLLRGHHAAQGIDEIGHHRSLVSECGEVQFPDHLRVRTALEAEVHKRTLRIHRSAQPADVPVRPGAGGCDSGSGIDDSEAFARDQHGIQVEIGDLRQVVGKL
jgi:hypothetical protein